MSVISSVAGGVLSRSCWSKEWYPLQKRVVAANKSVATRLEGMCNRDDQRSSNLSG